MSRHPAKPTSPHEWQSSTRLCGHYLGPELADVEWGLAKNGATRWYPQFTVSRAPPRAAGVDSAVRLADGVTPETFALAFRFAQAAERAI